MCELEDEFRDWLQAQLELMEQGSVSMDELKLQVREYASTFSPQPPALTADEDKDRPSL
jgi:hypothetical protein